MAPAHPPPGTVRFKAMPGSRLPGGPVLVRFTPQGKMIWVVDEAQIDPLLQDACSVFGNIALAALYLPNLAPDRVRLHRDRSLGGNSLLVADIADTIDIRVPRELIKVDLARHLELQATYVLRTILQAMPVIGQNGTPPAA